MFLDYWTGLLGMSVYSKTDTTATLGYADEQVSPLSVQHWTTCVVVDIIQDNAFVTHRPDWSSFKYQSLLIVLKHLEGLLLRAPNQR